MEIKKAGVVFLIIIFFTFNIMTSSIYSNPLIYNQDGFSFSGMIEPNEILDPVVKNYNNWPNDLTKVLGAFAGGVYDGTNVWMIPHNADVVIKMNATTREMTKYNNWPVGFTKNIGAFSGGVFDGTHIWMIPYHAESVIKINTSTGVMTEYNYWPEEFVKRAWAFSGGIYDGAHVWMIPHSADRIIKINVLDGSMEGYDNWPVGFEKGREAFVGGVFDGSNVWMIPYNADRVIKVDVSDGTMQGYDDWPAGFTKDTEAFAGGVYDGSNVWMIPKNADRVIRVDASDGSMEGYNSWPAGFTKSDGAFSGGVYDGTYIWMTPRNADRIVKLDTSTGNMSEIDLTSFETRMIHDIAAGSNFSLVLKNDGTVWSWGNNSNGRLGDGSNISTTTPVQVVGENGEGFLQNVVQVAAGNAHALAVKKDGTVWAWGSNASGRLGDGTSISSSTPVQVVGENGEGFLQNVVQVTAGEAQSHAVKADGTVWAWGSNSSGRLGDGTDINSSTPVQVVGLDGEGFLENIIKVDGFRNHTIALAQDGIVWNWGRNHEGQLGVSGQEIRYSPVVVRGPDGTGQLQNIVDIGLGHFHGVGLRADGTVWTWGAGTLGALGDNTLGMSRVPRQVRAVEGDGYLEDIKSITVSDHYVFAVRANGEVVRWGRHEGVVEIRPVRVMKETGPMTNVLKVASKYERVKALTTDGRVWQMSGGIFVEVQSFNNVYDSKEELVVGDKDFFKGGVYDGNTIWMIPHNARGILRLANRSELSTTTELMSIAGETDLEPGGGNGETVAQAITWNINLDHEKETIELSDIVILEGTTKNIYTNSNFEDGEITGSETIELVAGEPVTIYVKLTAEDEMTSKFYAITINSANLSSLSTSIGALNPSFDKETEDYRVNVANSVSRITLTPTVENREATITVNGEIVSSGHTSEPINLHVGTNIITVVVTSQNTINVKTYTLAVRRQAPIVVNETLEPEETTTEKDNVINEENKYTDSEEVNKEDVEFIDNRVIITTEVKEDLIIEKLNQNVRNIIFSTPENAENVAARLNVETVKRIKEREAEIEVKNDIASYRIPAAEIVKDEIIKKIGENVDAGSIEVNISVKRAEIQKAEKLENISRANGFEVLTNPVEFKVSLIHEEKRVEINGFNRYIERRIAIPANVDISRPITGVVLETDGTLRQVPTRIVEVEGGHYAIIRSITNSIYSIISNSIEFKDAENHWARENLNDMGSRFIISGKEQNIEPEREVTRGEFIGIVLRVLGIRGERVNTSFEDILEIDDRDLGYIETAYEKGLISGYEDGNFRANRTITREEALVIISRAMKITGLEVLVTDGDLETFINEYQDFEIISNWSKNSIAKSIKAGIIVGRGIGSLEVNETLNISEVATMVRNLLQKSDLI